MPTASTSRTLDTRHDGHNGYKDEDYCAGLFPCVLGILCVLRVRCVGCSGDNPIASYLTANQLKFPTHPVAPTASMTTRTTCVPEASEIPVAVMVRHVCQPPVLGTVSAPVLSTPSTSTWNTPPAPFEATRTSTAYVPVAATATV